MIVDPETGMPIGLSATAQAMQSGYDPSSLTGAVGITTAQSYGINNSALFRTLEHIPSASATMGWNAMRGGNTILGGGYRQMMGPGRAGVRQMLGQGVAGGGFNLRAWTRLGHSGNIDSVPTAGKGAYSPFNFLADVGNRGARWGVGNIVKAAEGGDARAAKAMSRMRKMGITPGGGPGESTEYFSRGMMSRLNAASRLYGSGGKNLASRAGNVYNFIQGSNPKLAQAATRAGMLGPGGKASATQLADLTIGSARGTVSQYVGGYMRGAKFGNFASDTANVLIRGGSKATVRGAGSAVGHLADAGLSIGRSGKLVHAATGKTGMRAGAAALRSAGLSKAGGKAAMALGARAGIGAVPVVGQAIMAAWMAYDVAQMGISAMTGAADFVKDAGKSLKGTIDKPVMGMGYQDNAVAATSRARGVQAIANSRLNARSVLGSEGAMLAAHFG